MAVTLKGIFLNWITVKILKIRTSEKFAVITLKFEKWGFTRDMLLKDADRTANSVDPDQGSTLFA